MTTQSFLSRALAAVLLFAGVLAAHAVGIDRKAIVRSFNPHTEQVGTAHFLLGAGTTGSFRVDATALQTFNTPDDSPFSVGLNLTDAARVDSLSMTLDRWSGKADSRFRYGRRHYRVETVYAPAESQQQDAFLNWIIEGKDKATSVVASRVSCDSTFEIRIVLRFAAGSPVKLIRLKNNAAIRGTDADGNMLWLRLQWNGKASVSKQGDHVVLRSKAGTLELAFYTKTTQPHDDFYNETDHKPFTDYALSTATGWSTYWSACGFADFSAVADPAARLLQGRMVEALYNMAADTPADWWQQSPFTLYGFPRQVAKTLELQARRDADLLTARPEFIAVAELMLRAYVGPEMAERNRFSATELWRNYSTVIGAYGPYVAKAAETLSPGQPLPAQLSAVGLHAADLLSTAQRWHEAYDSLSRMTRIPDTPSLPYRFTTAELFRPAALPSPANAASGNTSTLAEAASALSDSDFLLLLAARRWPAAWKVATEGLLPLP